jgi:hypothetical protein
MVLDSGKRGTDLSTLVNATAARNGGLNEFGAHDHRVLGMDPRSGVLTLSRIQGSANPLGLVNESGYCGGPNWSFTPLWAWREIASTTHR